MVFWHIKRVSGNVSCCKEHTTRLQEEERVGWGADKGEGGWERMNPAGKEGRVQVLQVTSEESKRSDAPFAGEVELEGAKRTDPE